jgi:hypothetical protein
VARRIVLDAGPLGLASKPPGSEGFGTADTPQKLGGARTWLVCPGCGRRVASLDQPTPGPAWLCRACHGLTYLSRREHRRDEAMTRIEARVLPILHATHGDWQAVARIINGPRKG